MAFPGSTFPNPCNRAPLRRFLPTPKRMHAFNRLLYAERESVNCLNIVWLPERAFHAESMSCSHSGLLFVSYISCWRRRHRPFKSRSLTPSKETSFKKRLVSPFEHGSAAEAEFAPRRRPLFVPRRRLLIKTTRIAGGLLLGYNPWMPASASRRRPSLRSGPIAV